MKMRKIKAAAGLTLALLMLASCSSESGPDAPPAESGQTTEAEQTTVLTETVLKDNLPDDLDFNGETVTFLYREELADDFHVDTLNGDIVNDAICDSFRSVEERLNADIAVVKRPGHDISVRSAYMTHISQTVMAGDSTYDWVDLMIGNSPVRMTEGIFADLLANPYLDFEQPWYLKGLADQMAINGRLYFVTSDASIDYLRCAYAIYFNQDLAADYGIESLYALVDSGKWTVDKLMEIAKAVSADTNNDGKYTVDDQLGFCVHDYYHLPAFLFSSGMEFISRSGGKLEFVYGSERDAQVVEKLVTLLHGSEGVYLTASSNAVKSTIEEYDDITKGFLGGRILMMSAQFDDAVTLLRDMESSYGILPFPKIYEEQDEYISGSRNTHNAFSMPITCQNPDMAGAVLEALGYENHMNLLPAYYEVALKTKYARDDDSSRMYDIILSNMTLNLGYIYNNALGGPANPFIDTIGGKLEFASSLAAAKPSVEVKITDYLAQLADK